MTQSRSLVADRLEPLGFCCPFLEPRLIVTHSLPETKTHAFDFIDLSAAPLNAAERQQRPVGPSVVVREIGECDFAFRQLGARHGTASCSTRTLHRRGIPESRSTFLNFSTSVRTTSRNASGALPTTTSPSCA